MCIAGSVGRAGRNNRDDVRTVQLLLQLNSPQAAPPVVADGQCGPGTITAVELYQQGVVGGADQPGLVTAEQGSDGRVGSTLRSLRQGMPAGLSAPRLQGIYIHTPSPVIARFFGALVAGMTDASISTPLRQSHFLAQLGHESAELRYTEELASGAAYEGRKDLGNCEPGDGTRFKGRGLIQLTGRANYVAFGRAISADLTCGDAPRRIATEPDLAVQAAVWFWQTHGLNALADADDVVALTRKINGGTNGLDDRKRLLARAKWFLEPMVPAPARLAGVQAYGVETWAVEEWWDFRMEDTIFTVTEETAVAFRAGRRGGPAASRQTPDRVQKRTGPGTKRKPVRPTKRRPL